MIDGHGYIYDECLSDTSRAIQKHLGEENKKRADKFREQKKLPFSFWSDETTDGIADYIEEWGPESLIQSLVNLL